MTARPIACRPPTVIETLRLNLSQAENALRTEDPVLLGRCVLAFGPMVDGLRAMAQDLGADLAVPAVTFDPSGAQGYGSAAAQTDVVPVLTLVPAAACRSAPLSVPSGLPLAIVCADQGTKCDRPASLRVRWRAWRCRPWRGQDLSLKALTGLWARATGRFLWRLVLSATQPARST